MSSLSEQEQQSIFSLGYNFSKGDMIEVEYMIHDMGFEETYQHLASNPIDPLRTSPLLESHKRLAEMDLLNYRKRQPSMKGVYKCRKCLSDETISSTKQTRSADEPMTVLIRCIHCDTVWRVQ